MPKRADADLLSPEWRRLVMCRKKDADFLAGCKLCGSHENLRLDHVIERKDGGAAFDPANTQWLCNACNVRKGARAKRRRAGLAR